MKLNIHLLILGICMIAATNHAVTTIKKKPILNNMFKEIKGVHDFEKEMSSPKSVVIEFYTPWCGFCKSMEKPYKEVAHKYKQHISFIKINADLEENKPIAQRFNVTSFPTIVTKIVTIDVGAMTKEELDEKAAFMLDMMGKRLSESKPKTKKSKPAAKTIQRREKEARETLNLKQTKNLKEAGNIKTATAEKTATDKTSAEAA